MSDKPEKIWLNTDTSFRNGCYIDTQISKVEMANRVKYIRADLAKPSEWISAEKDTPEGITTVVARHHYNTPYTAQYVRGTWYDQQGLERDPSHWMELPERKP